MYFYKGRYGFIKYNFNQLVTLLLLIRDKSLRYKLIISFKAAAAAPRGFDAPPIVVTYHICKT